MVPGTNAGDRFTTKEGTVPVPSFCSFVVPLCVFVFAFTLFLITPLRAGETFDHSQWDLLLKQFVRNGLVDYEAFFKDRKQLDDYLAEMENFSVDALAGLGREERIAFWMNLYNASVIRMILDDYPIRSVDEIPAVFEIRTIRAAGDFFSLSELRDEVLRKGFRDERTLLGLASGRMDSPKLVAEAFRGETLEAQLNRAAKEFVGDSARNQIEPGKKKIFLSPLFRNFGADFLLNYGLPNADSGARAVEAAVVSFFLHHLRDPERRLYLDSGRYKIHYLPEDPRLNDIHNEKKY